MNKFMHKCRKLNLDGKDRESSLNPKQWEYLKESMCAEYFFEKSARGEKGRYLVKAQYILGRGSLRDKQHMCMYMVFLLNSLYCILHFLFVYISNTLCVDNHL